MSGDLVARLRAHADADPTRVALTFGPPHRDGARTALTYGELVARSCAMAGALAARVRPGARAMLILPPAPEFAVTFLGCLAAGVIAVPVPPPAGDGAVRRVAAVAEDCAVSLIVSTAFVREAALHGTPETRHLAEAYEWLLVDAPGAMHGTGALPAIAADDIAFLQYTSGSTSTPRGVRVSHGALMANEAAIRASFGVTEDSTIVSWLPLHHDMGLIGGLLQPLYTGGRGVILDPLSFVHRPASWLEAIAAERADISGGPNFAYDLCTRKVTDDEKARLDLSSWRVAFNGAAPVFPHTMRSFSTAFRDTGFLAAAHTPCYGLAEATLLVATAQGGSATFDTEALAEGRAEATPDDGRELVAYRLPDHATVRVVDPETAGRLPDGRVGEIVVAGPGNGSGYWGGQDDTFRVTVPGQSAGPFLRTGDLGFVRNGALYVTGRRKDLIVQRGRNVHPEDLEDDISRCHEDIRPGCGAVFGMPHDGDEAVVVCQEIRQGTRADRHALIAARIRAALATGHGVTARTVVLVPPRTVEKTSSGKVRRHAARARFAAGDLPALHVSTVDTPERVPPLADRLPAAADAAVVTDVLRDHLREVLGLPERPGRDDSLPALGADSLTAARVARELETALGVRLRPGTALRSASIAELAATAIGAPPAVPSTPDIGDYELNAAQRALWFLHRALPSDGDYNVTRAFRLTGEVSAEAVAAALAAVVRRHSSLRLAVRGDGGVPRAEVRADADVRVPVVDARTWDEAAEAEWYRTFATTPFDLAADLLVRAALLRREHDWLLVLSLHHVVCDVASFGVLVAELVAEYAGLPVPVAPPVSPAALERAVLAERADELAAYWRDRLAGELPALTLPVHQGAAPGTGEALAFTAGAVVAAGLTRFARESGLTLHNVLLTAYQVVLHRLTGQPDLVVGVPADGRTDRALESWIGYLVNVLPIRSAYAEGTTFPEFARTTQATVLDALDHQQLPLSEITRLVNPDRETVTGTVFQAMFSCYTTALPGGVDVAAVVMGDRDASVPCGPAVLHGHPVPDHTTQSDLGLNVAVRPGRLDFQLQYDRDVVSGAQAGQVAATYLTLLAALATRPDTEVGALPLLTPAEVSAVVAAGVGPDVARPGNYLDYFERMAGLTPDAVAVDDGTVLLTYAELDARANHVARRLRAEGVGVDGNVVVCAARSADYLVALVGIHKADGCYVPVSPREAPRRAAAMVATVEPTAAIADASGRALLPGALNLAELVAGSGTRPPRLCPEHGASTIIHTSGSTGVPKAAVSTNFGVTNHMWQLAEHFGLGADDCVAQTAPVSFDISVWQLLTPLMLGGRVRIVPEPVSQSPAGLLRSVVDGGVTMLELVPSNIVALLDAGLAATPGDLRVMLSTGEALTGDVLRRWVRGLPHIPVHNAYGPAECTDDVTAGLCAHGPDGPFTTAVGRPLANTSVLVLDDELRPVPPGVVGVLHVGGGAVGRGYRGNPRRTAEAFVPDPWSAMPGGRLYRTGDLGRVSTDGDVEFLGRADRQIKIRGQRIEAGEVEAALRECARAPEAAVKVHNGPAGASLVGYVATGGGEDGAVRLLDVAEDERLRTALAELLPRHMIPTVLVSLGALPRSKNGKVDHAALDYPAPESPDRPTAESDDDPVAAAVRGIWADLLARDTIGGQESFFQLGGHSLLALTMIDRVEQTVGVALGVDAVFAHPRLGDFVAAVHRADPATPRPVPHRVPSAAPVPASTAQQRFWYLRELDPDRPAYNMPGVLRMRGVLDADALDDALHEVLARHPVLLARFATTDGALTWTPRPATDFTLNRLDLRGAVAEFGDEVFDRLVAEEAGKVTDPRHDLPVRALLARLGQKDWALFVTIDHLVCDGWSLSVFLTDLAHAYNRRLSGATGRAPRDGYGFAEYCRDEQAVRDGQDRDAMVRLWRGVGDGPVVRAPLSSAPGAPGAGRHTRWVGDDLAAGIRDLAGRTGTTPYLVFVTALSALVHSGGSARETVLLGTLIAQRDRPEWTNVVGPLLNVSVLAVDLAATDTGAEAMTRARAGALRAYRCAGLPFQDLVPLLPSAADGTPFDVLVVMQPGDGPVEFDGLTTELTDVDTAAAPYPLLVDIEARDLGYRVSYRYATDRYGHADVEDLATRVHAALRVLVADANRTVAELAERS